MLNFKLKKNKTVAQRLADSPQNPKVLEVNLIKNEIPIDFDFGKHLGTLLFSLLVAAIFIAEIYFGLNWWSDYENKRVLEAEVKFNQVSAEIKTMKSESDEILAFKQRLDLTEALLDNHIYWTNFFNWLEKNTISSVNYNSFTGGADGVYELGATAKTFRDVSWQTRALLEDPAVISVSVDSADTERTDAPGQEKNAVADVNFVLSLKVSPSLFKENLK